jgi:nicotinamide-nucleotide amidase
MRAEIIGVGTEILLGQICNENAQWISTRLAEIGWDVLNHQTVGDNQERIAAAFRLAVSRADAVIATGGLGPTQDDVTREGLAMAFGLGLSRDPDLERFLRERFAALGREMPLSNLRQCDVLPGARSILPQRGTAPGLILDGPGGVRVYLVPGVPSEMREMMTGAIVPELSAMGGPSALVSRILKVVDMAEARVGELLDDLYRSSRNPTVAYLAGGGEVRIRLTAKAPSRGEAEELLRPLAEEVARRLGDHMYTADDEDLEQVIGRLLKSRSLTVAGGESLTGGGLGVRLSSAPGSSAFFKGSAVCYSGEAKSAVLGVRRETLDGPGAVSEQAAIEMAQGARKVFGADVGLALTGVAGPEEHDGKPVGTVCVALSADGVDQARTFRAPGDRHQVRRWAEQAALDMLRRYLTDLPEPPDPGPATS